MTKDEEGALIGLASQWDSLSRILGPDQRAALGKCSEDLRQLVAGLQEMAEPKETNWVSGSLGLSGG